ncbi:MAG: non-canonical purine NTP pyrophosphatase [Ilumatobacteraceae bacterium]
MGRAAAVSRCRWSAPRPTRTRWRRSGDPSTTRSESSYPGPPRSARRRGGRRHPRRQRPLEGPGPRRRDRTGGHPPTTPASVDALAGAPGVYTARFAGEEATYADNRAKLLIELADVPDGGAAFKTVALVRWPDGRELAVEGVCPGVIATEERGQRGFGYDAVFIPVEGDGRTFAEMSEDEKHAVSHRGRAFRALLAALDQTAR